MAPVLGKSIHATMTGKKLKSFAFKELGQMAVIGHLCGIAEVAGIRFSGVLAFLCGEPFIGQNHPASIVSSVFYLIGSFMHSFQWISHNWMFLETEKVDRSHYQKGSFVFKEVTLQTSLRD